MADYKACLGYRIWWYSSLIRCEVQPAYCGYAPRLQQLLTTYGVFVDILLATVLGITNAAADFLAPTGNRVNSIAPALVYSAIINNLRTR